MTAAIPIVARFATSLAANEVAQSMQNDDSDESIPAQSYDLGNGMHLYLSPQQFKQLLHSDIVIEAITARAQGVVDLANATSQEHGALYKLQIQNRPDTTRARAFARPGNMPAVVDERKHSTLLKAFHASPSDPKLENTARPSAVTTSDGADDIGELSI